MPPRKANSSASLLTPGLQQLADMGFDRAVLLSIENKAMSEAVALREIKGDATHSDEEIRSLAKTLVPTGLTLREAYASMDRSMSSQSMQTLQRVAHQLEQAAGGLERIAARSAARPMKLAEFALVQQSIGTRYASLLQAAQTLERSGLIPVFLRRDLSQLTARPDGPLEPFYDKALTLIDERTNHQPAARARATC